MIGMLLIGRHPRARGDLEAPDTAGFPLKAGMTTIVLCVLWVAT